MQNATFCKINKQNTDKRDYTGNVCLFVECLFKEVTYFEQFAF